MLVIGGPRTEFQGAAGNEEEEDEEEVDEEEATYEANEEVLAGRFSTLEHTPHLMDSVSLSVPQEGHSVLF